MGGSTQTPRNIGIDHWSIAVEMRRLLEDAQFWIANRTYSQDEIAVRFHHRLVFIHPFPNGNGRHARLAADLLVTSLGQKRFSWGRASLKDAGETRRRYITALRCADQHDIEPILSFARA